MRDVPEPDKVFGTLERRRTGLRSADCPGDGTASSLLHLVVFSLLQSRARQGISGALRTLWQDRGEG